MLSRCLLPPAAKGRIAMDCPPPRISIVMPVFNEAALLPSALDSVTRQSLSDFECVVGDDGSTDATAMILAEYARRDPRFRIVRQANGGISRALNAGLAAARAP